MSITSEEATRILKELFIELEAPYNFEDVLVRLSAYKPDLVEAFKEVIGYVQRESG